MFKAFNRIPRLPTSIVASANISPTPVVRSSMAASQPQMVRLPDHIPVPLFGKKTATVAQVAAPVVEPASTIPVVEPAPVAPAFIPPSWPNPNVVRSYVTNGHARIRFTSIKTEMSRDFRIFGVRRANGMVDFKVEIERRNASSYAFGNAWCYAGLIFARSLDFRMSSSIEDEYQKEAAFFGRWWDAITQGDHIDGVTISCRESRAAERKAAKEAEKAAEAAAKWSASITRAATNAGAPPTPEATAAIHTALKAVRALDEDKATLRNAIGFSKSASYHGHALADLATLTAEQALVGRDLVRKYRKQIDANLVAQALDEAEAQAA